MKVNYIHIDNSLIVSLMNRAIFNNCKLANYKGDDVEFALAMEKIAARSSNTVTVYCNMKNEPLFASDLCYNPYNIKVTSAGQKKFDDIEDRTPVGLTADKLNKSLKQAVKDGVVDNVYEAPIFAFLEGNTLPIKGAGKDPEVKDAVILLTGSGDESTIKLAPLMQLMNNSLKSNKVLVKVGKNYHEVVFLDDSMEKALDLSLSDAPYVQPATAAIDAKIDTRGKEFEKAVKKFAKENEEEIIFSWAKTKKMIEKLDLLDLEDIVNNMLHSQISSDLYQDYKDVTAYIENAYEEAMNKAKSTGAVKEVKVPGTELVIKKLGMDTNGNHVITFAEPNKRGFSIQTNGNMPETHKMRGYKPKELSEEQLNTIAKELKAYQDRINAIPTATAYYKPDTEKMIRKPSNLKEIFSSNKEISITPEIEELPVYTEKEVFDKENWSITDDFASEYPLERVFVMDTPKGKVLVDTQGFDYPRYAVKLVGTATAEFSTHDVEMLRKPKDLREIMKSDLELHTNSEINKLPRLSEKEVFGKDKWTIADDVLEGIPSVFVMGTKEGDVLVDRQGYSYVRYAVKLVMDDVATADAPDWKILQKKIDGGMGVMEAIEDIFGSEDEALCDQIFEDFLNANPKYIQDVLEDQKENETLANTAPIVHNEVLFKGKEPSFANPGWRAATYTLMVYELPTLDNVAGRSNTVDYKAEITYDPGYPDRSGVKDVLNKGRIDTSYVHVKTKEEAVKLAKEAFNKMGIKDESGKESKVSESSLSWTIEVTCFDYDTDKTSYDGIQHSSSYEASIKAAQSMLKDCYEDEDLGTVPTLTAEDFKLVQAHMEVSFDHDQLEVTVIIRGPAKEIIKISEESQATAESKGWRNDSSGNIYKTYVASKGIHNELEGYIKGAKLPSTSYEWQVNKFGKEIASGESATIEKAQEECDRINKLYVNGETVFKSEAVHPSEKGQQEIKLQKVKTQHLDELAKYANTGILKHSIISPSSDLKPEQVESVKKALIAVGNRNLGHDRLREEGKEGVIAGTDIPEFAVWVSSDCMGETADYLNDNIGERNAKDTYAFAFEKFEKCLLEFYKTEMNKSNFGDKLAFWENVIYNKRALGFKNKKNGSDKFEWSITTDVDGDVLEGSTSTLDEALEEVTNEIGVNVTKYMCSDVGNEYTCEVQDENRGINYDISIMKPRSTGGVLLKYDLEIADEDGDADLVLKEASKDEVLKYIEKHKVPNHLIYITDSETGKLTKLTKEVADRAESAKKKKYTDSQIKKMIKDSLKNVSEDGVYGIADALENDTNTVGLNKKELIDIIIGHYLNTGSEDFSSDYPDMLEGVDGAINPFIAKASSNAVKIGDEVAVYNKDGELVVIKGKITSIDRQKAEITYEGGKKVIPLNSDFKFAQADLEIALQNGPCEAKDDIYPDENSAGNFGLDPEMPLAKKGQKGQLQILWDKGEFLVICDGVEFTYGSEKELKEQWNVPTQANNFRGYDQYKESELTSKDYDMDKVRKELKAFEIEGFDPNMSDEDLLEWCKDNWDMNELKNFKTEAEQTEQRNSFFILDPINNKYMWYNKNHGFQWVIHQDEATEFVTHEEAQKFIDEHKSALDGDIKLEIQKVHGNLVATEPYNCKAICDIYPANAEDLGLNAEELIANADDNGRCYPIGSCICVLVNGFELSYESAEEFQDQWEMLPSMEYLDVNEVVETIGDQMPSSLNQSPDLTEASSDLKTRWENKIKELKEKLAKSNDPASRFEILDDIKHAEEELSNLAEAGGTSYDKAQEEYDNQLPKEDDDEPEVKDFYTIYLKKPEAHGLAESVSEKFDVEAGVVNDKAINVYVTDKEVLAQIIDFIGNDNIVEVA